MTLVPSRLLRLVPVGALVLAGTETFGCSGRNERGVQLEIGGKVTDSQSGSFDYSVDGHGPETGSSAA